MIKDINPSPRTVVIKLIIKDNLKDFLNSLNNIFWKIKDSTKETIKINNPKKGQAVGINKMKIGKIIMFAETKIGKNINAKNIITFIKFIICVL